MIARNCRVHWASERLKGGTPPKKAAHTLAWHATSDDLRNLHHLLDFMLKSMAFGAEDPHIPIAVGITVGLVASFIQSLGLTIQRKSHVQNQKLPDGERKVEHRRP